MNYANSRQLFPGLKLIKKEVNERFLEATRNIYEKHPTYTFNRKEKETKILIYPSHGNPEFDGKQPRILTKVGAYQYHLNDTLNNNFAEDIVQGNSVIGSKTKQIIRLPITIMVHAYSEEESSDIADELGSIIIYACRRYYSSCGLVPSNIQVSETDVFNRDQDIYQTVINAVFDVPWTNATYDAITIPDFVVGFDLPKTKTDYREPGVAVNVVDEGEVSFVTFGGKTVTIKD